MARRFRWLRKKRILFPLAFLALLALFIGRPAWLIASAFLHDHDERRPPPAGMVDDASRLNQTPVAQCWNVPADEAEAETGLRQRLLDARRLHVPLSIAGARHSMGGQTLYPGGIQLDMLSHCAMTFDPDHDILHVQAGATWAQILAFLDPLKRSVAIMQSNNDFSVGGSLSVNCHGWQYDRPPIDSSVESFHLMLADGSIRLCSRSENPELFSLALGGYGLFGIMLDADLHTVPNERYDVQQFEQPAADFLSAASLHLSPVADIGMSLGRLSVAPDNFLTDSLLYVMRRAPLPSGEIPPLHPPSGSRTVRAVFLASGASDAGKTLRWQAESHFLTFLSGRYISRNQLLNESAEIFANHTDATTDILQEYFIPPDHLAAFLAALRTIVPRHAGHLLNVTVRDIREDHDSFLRYADKDVIALVLLYQIPRTPAVNPAFIALTRESIDAALACDGRYYLPYRLDATPAQFHRAYPMASKFFTLKRKYDPDELFQNAFYRQYSEAPQPTAATSPR